MTPQEFYEWMKNAPQGNITLPVPIRLGSRDAMAARLLLWLFEEMPENSTQGDLEDILDTAKWWSIFWGSAFKADTMK